MCRPNERTHKHHIIPRYMSGSNDPENIVEVTVTQHVMFHFCNYHLWGNEEDRLAWRGLSGLITPDEVALEAMSLGGKKGGNKHKENKTGICGMTSEELSGAGKKGGPIGGKIGGNKTKENKTGIFGRSPEKRKEDSRKAGKIGGSKGGKQLLLKNGNVLKLDTFHMQVDLLIIKIKEESIHLKE